MYSVHSTHEIYLGTIRIYFARSEIGLESLFQGAPPWETNCSEHDSEYIKILQLFKKPEPMPTRTWKPAVVQVAGEEGNARSKPVKRGSGLHSFTSSGRTSRIDCDLFEPRAGHMKRLSLAKAIHGINFSQHEVTVEGVSGRFHVKEQREEWTWAMTESAISKATIPVIGQRKLPRPLHLT